MGRIVVVNFVSIDGVIQSPLSPQEDTDGGFVDGGWVRDLLDEQVESFMQGATTTAAALLLGRRTYEILEAAWSGGDEADPAVVAMNRMPKYIVTRRRVALLWNNSRALSPDLAVAVPELSACVDGDVVVLGSAELILGLAAHGLVDEYRLVQFPVVLGAGKRMFGQDAAPARFTLSAAETTASGAALLTYRRGR